MRDKSMTRTWREHDMTRAWQYDKNMTDVNHAFIMNFEIHMFLQGMNQVSHAPTSFTPITSLPPETKSNSRNTCLGVSKTWGSTSRQTSKLSNLKVENLTNFQTVWGASLPESLSSSRHNQTRHRERSSPTQVTTERRATQVSLSKATIFHYGNMCSTTCNTHPILNHKLWVRGQH